MIPYALWGGAAALAWAGLDGSSAIIAVPTVDTQPPSQVTWSLAMAGRRDSDGLGADLLPLGMVFGYTRRVEFGAVVDRNPSVLASRHVAEISARLRARAVDPLRYRPGLALEASVGVLRGDSIAEGLLVASTDGSVTLSADLGARLSTDRALLAAFGAGVEGRMDGKGALMFEVSGLADGRDLDTLEGRLGVRARLRSRMTVLAWTGGGQSHRSPWLGAGIAVSLSSVDVKKVDIDGDKVTDWSDNCRYMAEDLDTFEDEDGCPDVDNDADGIPDALDDTPNGGVAPVLVDPFPGDVPTLKIHIQQREVPGPLSPADRTLPAEP